MSFYFETGEAFFHCTQEKRERDCQSGIKKKIKYKNKSRDIMDKESTGCVNNGS